jgi:tetratricopeptide (TPR) repeat protein
MLRMKFQTVGPIAFLFIFLLLLSGCSARARADRHLKRGDEYYAKSEFSKAKLEYLNAARKGARDSRVLSRLGECFLREGDVGPAYQCLSDARNLQPTNIVARQTLASLLIAFGQTKKAHDEAEEILKYSPDDPQGLILLAQTSTTPEEIAAARKRLESIQSSAPNNSSVLFSLGLLAEKAKEADKAKDYYQKAVSLDAKQSRYHLALAILSEEKGDTNTADASFKSAVALAPIKSWDRLSYADYLERTGRTPEAQKFLEQTIAQAPDFSRGINALTELLLKEKKLDEAEKYNAKALALSSTDRDGLINRARLKLARGDKAGALAELQELSATRPKDAQVQYQLAVAALANNDPIKARTAIDTAVTLDPKHAQSVILRSELQLTKGEVNDAIVELLRISRENPKLTEPLFLLGQAYRGRGTPNDALPIYQSLAKALPNDVRPYHELGVTYRQLKKTAEAQEAFNQALQIKPDNVASVDELTLIDIFETKNLDAAIARLLPYARKYTNSPMPQFLLAKVYTAQNKPDEAIRALKKSLEIAPNFADAQRALVHMYATTGKQADAIAELEGALKKNPKDTSTLFRLAQLQEAGKDFKAARATYENILKINPTFPPALNNLAIILSDRLNDLDGALGFAGKAREIAPADPIIGDTYGWILWRKGDFQRALSVLSQSSEKLAQNAEARSHLGMAQYSAGLENDAVSSLELAVTNKAEFAGKDVARNALTILKINPAQATVENLQLLRETLQKQAWDSIAQLRLAQVLDSQKKWEEAAQAYDSVLKLNPRSTVALLRLAELNCFTFAKPERGLEYARQAWSISQDPALAAMLGPVGSVAGDFKWASSILSQARRAQPNDKRLAFYEAIAAYGLGNISQARRTFAEVEGTHAVGALAKQALPLLDYQLNSADSTAAANAAKAALQIDPKFAPAIIADGLLAEEKKDWTGARARYEEVLKNSPAHIVAQRQLGLLLAEKLNDDQRASELLVTVKSALPGDSEITKTLGKIAYRRADYTEAARLLRDASLKLPKDPDLLYHLGMAQYHLNDPQSKDILARALKLDSNSTMAASARKALEELNR